VFVRASLDLSGSWLTAMKNRREDVDRREQLLDAWQSLLVFQRACKTNLVNAQSIEGDLKGHSPSAAEWKMAEQP